MFKWFKNKDKKVVVNKNNYETKENGDIKIRVKYNYWYTVVSDIVIAKDDIASHTENSIMFKCYRDYYNFESYNSIENKENYIKYKETQLETYEYSEEEKCWTRTNTDVVETKIVYEKTPLEVFKENHESQYKLLETEEEFNDYIKSTLDCDTWCRKKLYDKMKELGLGDGFINQFADLVGNDLDKYHAMIDLANEVTDKDTLMYLYTYKFSK